MTLNNVKVRPKISGIPFLGSQRKLQNLWKFWTQGIIAWKKVLGSGGTITHISYCRKRLERVKRKPFITV